MKLIDYVIENDDFIEDHKRMAKYHGMEIRDFILTGYCPTAFSCVVDSEYGKPYSEYRANKKDCTYFYKENAKKCNECWNREILTTKNGNKT